MKKIIVATDYSATANNAVQFGASLAQAFKADLVLLNVYHPDIHVSNSLISAGALDQIFINNENRLKALARETAGQYQIHVEGVSKSADTVAALADYITSHETDLVIMGMDSNLTEYKWLGNTTTTAIRQLNCPLLVVPNDISFKGIGKILYACEYTYLSEDNHLELLKEMTRKFEAELQVLHVQKKTEDQTNETTETQIRAIDAILGNVPHTYNFVKNTSITDGIIHEMESWKADLLVMVPHKAGFWESLTKGSSTRAVTLKTRVPLLVLPNAN